MAAPSTATATATATACIYVLECADGCYYVGKTRRAICVRVEEHVSSSRSSRSSRSSSRSRGCAWTRLHPPLRVVRVVENAAPLDEDRVTKETMWDFGVDRVRGGSYTAVELPSHQALALRDEMCTADDRCLRCQRRGHFARDCWANCNSTKRKRE